MLSFRCCTCGHEGGDDGFGAPELAFRSYMDAVEWSDEEHRIPDNTHPDFWQRSDALPEPGQTRVIQVRHPFHEILGREFRTFYQPALSNLNGWEEHPEEIDRSAFVRCRSEEVLGR